MFVAVEEGGGAKLVEITRGGELWYWGGGRTVVVGVGVVVVVVVVVPRNSGQGFSPLCGHVLHWNARALFRANATDDASVAASSNKNDCSCKRTLCTLYPVDHPW